MREDAHFYKKNRRSMQYRGTECLNCGHPLDRSDIYCPYCSQLNSRKQLSFKDYLAEFLGSILVYDSRLRHTLRDLFKPGLITKNYVKGQHLKYANPFRFFLSVSIIFYLFKSIVGTTSPNVNIEISDTDQISDSISLKKPPPILISHTKGDTTFAKTIGITHYLSEEKLEELPFVKEKLERASLYLEYHYMNPDTPPLLALKQLKHTNSTKNRWIYYRMVSFKKILQNPQDFYSYLSSKIPFFLFFFTPLFALIFWILYSGKGYSYMEHMIFIFHIFSFVFLIKLFITFCSLFINTEILDGILTILVIPMYFYLAMRRFYQQKRWITVIKTISILFVFSISFFISILLFIAGSAAIY